MFDRPEPGSALDLLRDGEICVVVIKGKEHEALWHAYDRHFVVIPEDMTDGYCECFNIEQVDEWWPAGVKF